MTTPPFKSTEVAYVSSVLNYDYMMWVYIVYIYMGRVISRYIGILYIINM